jgi:hypothetical protein
LQRVDACVYKRDEANWQGVVVVTSRSVVTARPTGLPRSDKSSSPKVSGTAA